MTKKTHALISVFSLLAFIAFTFVVANVDVRAIGPLGSSVGLAGINEAYIASLGNGAYWEKVSEISGYLAFAIVFFFAITGLKQWIKRKKILKVDKYILILGCMYILMLALYVLFDSIAINYRPILVDGMLDPSYPSSHTILALCVTGMAMTAFRIMFGNDSHRQFNARVIVLLLMILILIGRVLSGTHWISDIVGGVLISAAVVELYSALVTE